MSRVSMATMITMLTIVASGANSVMYFFGGDVKAGLGWACAVVAWMCALLEEFRTMDSKRSSDYWEAFANSLLSQMQVFINKKRMEDDADKGKSQVCSPSACPEGQVV